MQGQLSIHVHGLFNTFSRCKDLVYSFFRCNYTAVQDFDARTAFYSYSVDIRTVYDGFSTLLIGCRRGETSRRKAW